MDPDSKLTIFMLGVGVMVLLFSVMAIYLTTLIEPPPTEYIRCHPKLDALKCAVLGAPA